MKPTVLRLAVVTPALIGCCSLLPGCGGGGTPTPTGGAEQTLSFGPLVTRAIGTAQPPVTVSGINSTATGVAGATFSGMSLAPLMPSLKQTHILFVRYAPQFKHTLIWITTIDGTFAAPMSGGTGDDDHPAWSPDGSLIALDRPLNGGSGPRQIWTMDSGGSSKLHQIDDGLSEDTAPTWSPDGKQIGFVRLADGKKPRIFAMNADGTGARQVTDGTFTDLAPAWSPDGTKFAFARQADLNQIWVVNVDGSAAQMLNSNPFNNADHVAWSPDGSRIAFSRFDIGFGMSRIYTMNADGSNVHPEDDGFNSAGWPAWSPDGKRLAFQQNTTSNTTGPGMLFHIFTEVSAGISTHYSQQISTGPQADFSPSWSPFPKQQPLIGGNATMAPVAAGFLFGQSGPDVNSVLTFDTADPSTRGKARIVAQNPDGGFSPSNQIFTITAADSLSSLVYTNDPYGPRATNVITPGAAQQANAAIVSLDASTGQVAAVLPYTAATRSADASPRSSTEGSVLVLRGRFLGVWDRAGKNVAPSGASEVRMDRKSGKLVGIK